MQGFIFDFLDQDIGICSSLVLVEGSIRFLPGIKRAIKAFLQRLRDCYRIGRTSPDDLFDDDKTTNITRGYNTHIIL